VVEPGDVGDILLDAARLLGSGDIVVFGSAALSFWLEDPPRTRDVDIWLSPPERGEVVEALMGELSWYHDKHDAYVEVWGPETFAAPTSWRTRARVLTDDTIPDVRLVVPHPHDVLIAKLERWHDSDQEHARRILAAYPLSATTLETLAAETPYRLGTIGDARRSSAFEAHLQQLRQRL
jgi:hypothetical protein